MISATSGGSVSLRSMLNKVPEITLYFWIIKIVCTTVGETAADFLNTHFNLGLSGTSLVMGLLLVIALFFQLRAQKYIPGLYWLVVVLISVVGTLITDNVVNNLGMSLFTTSILFGSALAGTFTLWYAVENTLSIHSIFTTKREVFYWLAILFTFALGTSAGDLMAEQLHLGYLVSALIFGGLIALVTTTHYVVKGFLTFEHRRQSTNAVLAFWLAYILTRPLGASIGDYLSQSPSDGGLGLGTTITSMIFLALILLLVIYLTLTKKDEISPTIVE